MRIKDIQYFKDGGLNESKIQTIINKYSNGKSPLSAKQYIKVANETKVPVELLLAQSIQESNFGTKGRAVRTKNVGNVGNTDDGSAKNHGGWEKGLYAMANLLKNEYKVSSKSDISRLISNNFTRPNKGGNYASDPNYGKSIYNILSKIDNIDNYSYSPTSNSNSASDINVDYSAYKGVNVPNTEYGMYPILNYQSEQIKLTNHMLDELYRKKEFDNQQEIKDAEEARMKEIEFKFKQKQEERNQFLSMIPQANSIESDLTPKLI